MSNPCPTCGTENRLVARFCKHCAAALPRVVPPPAPQAVTAARVFCTSCGKPNAAQARFCRACGAAATGLEAAVPPTTEPPLSVPAALPIDPIRPREASPPRTALFALALLLLLLVAAAFWWQRSPTAPASAPAAQAEPREEILSDDRPTHEPQPPATTPMPGTPSTADTTEPTLTEPSAEAVPAATTTAPPAVPPRATAPVTTPVPPPQAAAPRATPPARATGPATASARPRATPEHIAASSPDANCAGRSNFTRPFCLSVQCFKSEFRQHPTCARLAEEVRQRRQYERDNNITGG